MPDVGTYRQVRPFLGYLQMQNQRYSRPDAHVFSFLRVFGHLSIWKPPFMVLASVRLGKVGRTCRYVPTSQSLSPVRGVYRISSLHSVDCLRPFSAMPDVGTYRLGASVARIPPSAQSRCSRPDAHVFSFFRVFWGASFDMETAVHGLSICTFWKGRTHLPVRPYIAIIIPRSWCLRASFAVSHPCIPLTARRCFPRCRYVWKSHATLTPLAKQDGPLWLQYN